MGDAHPGVPGSGRIGRTWHDGGVSSPTPAPSNGPSQPAGPYDPWSDSGEKPAESYTGLTGPGEVRDLALVAALVTAAGVVLGLLWWWLAPSVVYLSDGERAFLRNSEGEDTVSVDGTFALIAAGLGLLTGLLVFLLRRKGGINIVVGLALGSLLAGLVGWQVGRLLGHSTDLGARAEEAGRGGTFDGPLELNATIALLVWPLAALLTHLLVTALFGPRDPAPVPTTYTGWGGPPPAGSQPVPPGPVAGPEPGPAPGPAGPPAPEGPHRPY